MASNTSPRYPAAGAMGSVAISTANTNFDGTTGVYGSVITGGTNGTLIYRLTAQAFGDTTQGKVRWFLDDTVDVYCFHEMNVTPIAPGAGVPAWTDSIDMTQTNVMRFVLPSGWIIKASTYLSESFNCIAIAGDL